MLRPSLDDLWNRDLVGPLLMVGPVLLTTAYLYVSDLRPQWWAYTDIAAGLTIVAVGLAGVWMLPISRFGRGVVSIAYVLCAVVLTTLWAISFRGGL